MRWPYRGEFLMKPSISFSKITPPYLSRILSRPRLFELLEKNRDKKLILLLGQTAQGKSTLAASYIAEGRIPTAWVNLDREDSDAVRFFHLIAQSLEYTLRKEDFSDLASYPVEILDQGLPTSLYRNWAQSIFSSVSIPVRIVVDNLNQLPSVATTLKFLQILVEESPPSFRWILISRGFPSWSIEFQQLKIDRMALVLTNRDLAFTQEEIKSYFQTIRKISIKSDQAQKIFSATEGWIGGLILLSEMMNRFPESSVDEFISKYLPDYFNAEVFQYFGKEILSTHPAKIQQFLVQSSVLDLIEPMFTDELFGMEKTGEILRDHARENLFVESFYKEGRGWLFQFHPLFRSFLKAKFETTVGIEERRSLYLKAAELCEARNELESAMKFFLEAKAYARALVILERLGMDLLRSGRKSLLSEWVLRIPEEISGENPWVLLFVPMLRRYRMGKEDIASLDKARQLFKKTGDVRGQMISLAQLIVVSVGAGTHLVSVEELIEEGEHLLQSVQMNVYPYEEGTLYYCLGAGYIMGRGDIRKGISLCHNAYLISKRLGDPHLQASALNFEALGLVNVGEFSAAGETLAVTKNLLAKSGHPELKAFYLIVRCVLANRQGNFQESRGFLDELRREIGKYGFVRMNPWVYEISGFLELAGGKLEEAEKTGREYLGLASSSKNSLLKGLALRQLGLVYLHQGHFGKAKECVDQAREVLAKEVGFQYELNRVGLLKALVDSSLKADDECEKICEEALAYFNSILDYPSIAEAQFVMSLLHHKKRRKDKSIQHLTEGFKIAEEKKYGYFRILGYPHLARVCLMALNLEVSGAMDYAAHLLSTSLSGWAEKDLEEILDHKNPDVREKVWEIRRKIHRSKVARLSIETLGGLRIYRGNSLIEEKEWDRKQPKQLLMALLAHRGNRASKDMLIDDLWPDEKPGVAEKDFKTTLQRLRKSLEPVLHKDYGSSYIHLHDGYVSLDPELCEVDVDRFFSLIRKAEAEEKRREARETVTGFQAAVELYKGDFLPEEIHLPLVDMKREEISSKYIELLIKLAQLHEKQGGFRKAIECHKKAIQTDPLLEESYQRLMTLYSNKKMYNEALKIYEGCRKALKAGLKTEPDGMTNALYKKIMESINKKEPR
jgi:ATP/maltotriose-dependent transcriptional regulator MalT/two-component SAPR family response regulator